MTKATKRRWIALRDNIIRHSDGQVDLVKENEIILADEKPSRHFRLANPGEKGKPVHVLQNPAGAFCRRLQNPAGGK